MGVNRLNGEINCSQHPAFRASFSAKVELFLYVGDQRYELSSIGPGMASLRETSVITATEGEIETIVDEKVTRWPVRLTSRISGESKRFTFEAV